MPLRVLCVYIAPEGEEFNQRTIEFADSYYQHTAGIDHNLLVVSKSDIFDSHTYFNNVVHHPNVGYDIGSWLLIAKSCSDYDYMVCLGAYSRILVNDWLWALVNIVQIEEVGMVGTTASFEAGVSQTFPNPHVRTNGFIISPELLSSLSGPVTTKRECYEFEHGLNSMYRQLTNINLLCPIVGVDGEPYFENEWATSGIYRQGTQHNLLIADKQTDAFNTATEEEQLVLALMAGWHP